MPILTIASFLFFTALVGVLTWWITRKDDHKSSSGYFLGGRSLTFPLIAGSLLLTNLSTEQLIGLNGAAFNDGLCVMVWEVVAVIALVAMALFFLPRFLKSGVSTVPEYLKLRFDAQTQFITNLIFLVAYVAILLPIILYTGATGMNGILNVPEVIKEYLPAGVSAETVSLWGIVWAVGIVGSIYALFGGLRTVAVSDTLNGVGLLVGGLLIAAFSFYVLGGDAGFSGGVSTLVADQSDRFNSIGGKSSSVPFWTIFSGIFLLNLFYWTTNQQIIQRTLGASSLAEGQKGVLLTGALKLLGPFYLVLPGMIAYSMFVVHPEIGNPPAADIDPAAASQPADDSFGNTNADTAALIDPEADPAAKPEDELKADKQYGKLVNRVLPKWLTGFFAAAVIGAILSSFNSALNSACTLFSLGLYKPVINPNASEAQVVGSGKIFGWIVAIAAMSIAPLLAQTDSIFGYLQKMNGMYFIPIFAVVVVGMLSRRAPAIAAKIGLIAGFSVIAIGYFVPPFDTIVASMHDFQFLGVTFAWLVILMLVIGEVAPRQDEWVQQDAKAVDMTPWKYARLCGLLLVAIVISSYVIFADFSVLRTADAEQSVISVEAETANIGEDVQVTVSVYDAGGYRVNDKSLIVQLESTRGEIRDLKFNPDGSLTAILTSQDVGAAIITGAINQQPIKDPVEIIFESPPTTN